MSYDVHPINESPVITGEAGATISAPAMKVMAFDSNGKFVLPSASGAVPVGIALATKEACVSGDRMDVQWKGICFAVAGETIKRGYNLKAHTDGTVKQASAGDFMIGIALSDAASGKPVQIMITQGALPTTAASLSLSLKDLTDVDSELAPTAGQILKYDNTDHVFKAAADATE